MVPCRAWYVAWLVQGGGYWAAVHICIHRTVPISSCDCRFMHFFLVDMLCNFHATFYQMTYGVVVIPMLTVAENNHAILLVRLGNIKLS